MVKHLFRLPINTWRLRQNGRHFPYDILKWIFLNENVWSSIKISLKLVPNGSINNIPVLVLIMAWRQPGDKPLSEPMMVRLLRHICITRPQWVNQQCFWSYFSALMLWTISCYIAMFCLKPDFTANDTCFQKLPDKCQKMNTATIADSVLQKQLKDTFFFSLKYHRYSDAEILFFSLKYHHYSDAKTYQFTHISTVCPAVCSGWHDRRHHSSVSVALCGRFHQWPVDSIHKEWEMRKAFPCQDVIMCVCTQKL